MKVTVASLTVIFLVVVAAITLLSCKAPCSMLDSFQTHSKNLLLLPLKSSPKLPRKHADGRGNDETLCPINCQNAGACIRLRTGEDTSQWQEKASLSADDAISLPSLWVCSCSNGWTGRECDVKSMAHPKLHSYDGSTSGNDAMAAKASDSMNRRLQQPTPAPSEASDTENPTVSPPVSLSPTRVTATPTQSASPTTAAPSLAATTTSAPTNTNTSTEAPTVDANAPTMVPSVSGGTNAPTTESTGTAPTVQPTIVPTIAPTNKKPHHTSNGRPTRKPVSRPTRKPTSRGSPTGSSTNSTASDNYLSSGAIAGIVIAIIIVLVVGVLIFRPGQRASQRQREFRRAHIRNELELSESRFADASRPALSGSHGVDNELL